MPIVSSFSSKIPSLLQQRSSFSSFSLDASSAPSHRPSLRHTDSSASNTSASTFTSTLTAEPEADPDIEVDRLLHETRLWRAANSAQWVAWGIVQARVPGLESTEDNGDYSPSTPTSRDTPPTTTAFPLEGAFEEVEKEIETNEEEQESEEHFYYLAYAQDRALFFWADCVMMGLVDLEVDFQDARLRDRVRAKMINY